MKKGFIFSMDAFLAVILFTFIIFLIYTFSIGFTGLNQQYFFSDDLLTSFSETKINELYLNSYPKINNLITSGLINNTNVTLVQQIVSFQLENDEISSNAIIDDIISNVISGNLNTIIYIGGIALYPLDESNPENLKNILVRRRLAVGKSN